MIVSLQNPSDGGYQLDPLQYNKTILALSSHTFTPPANKQALGASGTDTWEFVAAKTGTTGLTITTSRGAQASTAITLFSGAISVK